MNDDDGESFRVEDQQEQGGGVKGRGVCNQGEGVVDVDLEGGRGGHGSFSQAICGMGW